MALSRVVAVSLAASAFFLGSGAAGAQAPLNITPQERNALAAAQSTAAGADRAAQDAALNAARAVARSADARYALGNLMFQIGRSRGDAQMQAQGADEMVASGVPQGADLIPLLANQAARAYTANQLERTDQLLTRMVELAPNNPAILADHAQFKARMGQRPASVALFQRAIEAQRASGQAVPQSWYQRAAALAVEARLQPQSVLFARELVVNYPTPANWRDALLTYRSGAAVDPELTLDAGRLLRAAGGLSGERDYTEFAGVLSRANHHGEAKAVLDEGVSRGMIDTTEPAIRQLVTANTRSATTERAGLARARTQALAASTGAAALAAGDAHFGNGQFAEAAELYRAALQKGGADANVVNTRLGAALAMAGQRTEAEAAFRAVTGPRADLASFWLAWLARRPTA